MQPYRATVVGSFPRPAAVSDTMKRPTVPQSEIDEIIRWAVCEQVELGLETVTDGEGYHENMYYFYQKRLDGVSMEYMVPQSFGTAGFGIECARVVGEIRNPRFNLAHNWRVARSWRNPESAVQPGAQLESGARGSAARRGCEADCDRTARPDPFQRE